MRTLVLLVTSAVAVAAIGCDALDHDMMSERSGGQALAPAASDTPAERFADAVAAHHAWMTGASDPEEAVRREDDYQSRMGGMMGGMMGAWPQGAAVGDELERHGTAMAEASNPAARAAEELRHHEVMMGLVDDDNDDNDRCGHM